MSELPCPICRVTGGRHKMDCQNAPYVNSLEPFLENIKLREAAKNRLKHGHHIFCMSGVRPTKGVLADIEPPEKYACDCGHDKLAALLQEKGE